VGHEVDTERLGKFTIFSYTSEQLRTPGAMDLQSSTNQFVEDLQAHFGRKLTFPREVGLLLEQATQQGLGEVFRDAIFQAKFVTRTREVMNRIGKGGEGFDNSIEKSSALLKTIVKESPEDIKQQVVKEFFGLDQESFGNFLKLLEDLSWVKNFELDGRPLPIAGSPSNRPAQNVRRDASKKPEESNPSVEFTRIRNGSALGVILMMALFVIDAPVTSIGWTLSVVVVLMLCYIALASHRLVRKSDTSV
jgi:hypothetical protein